MMEASRVCELCLTGLLARLQATLADRYAIDSAVGRGGMATVFLAKDLKHHRSVAIKVLHPELATSLGLERFLREIDIKPENIMFSAGSAVVADFGIARALTAATLQPLTASGAIVGTPAYMSPEQATSDAPLDGRSDIYSLGCVVYEMLTGSVPFTGPTAQAIMARHSVDVAPPIRSVRPTVSDALERAVLTALAKVPADRFATAAQFAGALAVLADPAAVGMEGESIAVLPFANLSGDPEFEYFSEGIAEEIINALTQLPGLRVAASTSSFAFRGPAIDLAAVGSK